MSKELLEEFEIKQKEEWKSFLQDKEFVPQLLNEAELYLESIQDKTIYDTLVEDLVKQVIKFHIRLLPQQQAFTHDFTLILYHSALGPCCISCLQSKRNRCDVDSQPLCHTNTV